MTLPWEDDPGDAPEPHVGQLAAVLASLFGKSRADGQPHVHILGHGLQLTVGTAKGDVIGLSRKGGEPSPEEAHTTAAQAGWRHYSSEWRTVQGARMLLIRPDTPAAREPEADDDPPDEAIRSALLERDAPWRNRLLSPWEQELRAAAVRAMTREELRAEYAWLGRHHGAALLARTRNRLAASLA